MMTVSTNGRSTPWNTGGSWRSLMMPDGHEHHPGAEVQRRVDEEIEIRLLELELAAFLEALDDRVLELELADEAQRGRKSGA